MNEFPRIETLGRGEAHGLQPVRLDCPPCRRLARSSRRAVRRRHAGHRHGARRSKAARLRVTGLSLKKSGGETETVAIGDGRSRLPPERLHDRRLEPRLHDQRAPARDQGRKRRLEALGEDRRRPPGVRQPRRLQFEHPGILLGIVHRDLQHPAFFDKMEAFSGNEAGTGGLVTFKDSNWLMSVVLYHQPHFAGQPKDVQVFWGYSLHPGPDRRLRRQTDVGLHRRGDPHRAVRPSQFRPHSLRRRHLHPLPHALHHQHVHAARQDGPPAAGAGEFEEPRLCQPVRRNPGRRCVHGGISVRAAQMAVYQLLGIKRKIPPLTRHDRSIKTIINSIAKSFA